MNCLVSSGLVEQYRPLADTKGSYSAQFEHVGSIFTSLPNEYTALTHTTLRLFYFARRTKRSLVAEMTIDIACSDAVEVNQSWSNHPHSKLDSPHRLQVWMQSLRCCKRGVFPAMLSLFHRSIDHAAVFCMRRWRSLRCLVAAFLILPLGAGFFPHWGVVSQHCDVNAKGICPSRFAIGSGLKSCRLEKFTTG